MTLILFLNRCFYSILPRIYTILNPTLPYAYLIPGFPGFRESAMSSVNKSH